MLLAEDLLLLLTDDTEGGLSDAIDVGIILAGANLVDLVLMGRIEVSRVVKPVRIGRLHWDRKVDRIIVGGPSPTGDAVLDEALHDVIYMQGKLSVIRQVDREGSLPETLYRRLVSNGMVRHERRTILAVAKVDRWPAQDSRHKVQVRQRVVQALVEQTTPDTRTAALIALLHTIEHEPVIVDPRLRAGGNYRLSSRRKDLLTRGEKIANSNWAPEALRNSIDLILDATKAQALAAKQGGGDGGGFGGG